ncbi:protein of unknown function [Methylocaldum szegediense]|uniref:Uncharacterized protein n=1 Tax=Methylocaldum szegediense TaxID=73780 RepID=A0ABN8WZP8_9GAMM|nr:protein of unknown function [Methylocaldum szegediense]
MSFRFTSWAACWSSSGSDAGGNLFGELRRAEAVAELDHPEAVDPQVENVDGDGCEARP